ncbi:MAG: mechanosensitive ion channel family protein [Deltaproteobacteria bacterium]|nr:mechanosensitive ion channel family protein [Deltaproteobacteria bacterium]
MELTELFDNLRASHTGRWVLALGVFLLGSTFLVLLRRALWSRLSSWARATAFHWDDMILEAARGPSALVLVTLAAAIALQVAPPGAAAHPFARYGMRLVLVFAALWMLERSVSRGLEAGSRTGTLSESTRRLVLTVLRVIVLMLGTLIVLDTVGVSITPLLASLGVGSIAVALALQEPLANFFAGLHLLLDRPVRIGDWVKLEDGTEGVVTAIGWRSTHVKTLSDNVMVIPNARFAQGRVVNYDLPTQEMSFTIELGVGYDSDLERVESVALEETRRVLAASTCSVPGADPVLLFRAFGASAMEFILVVRARRYVEVAPLRHALVKALHARFRQEKITIPYPQRVVHMAGGRPG